MAKRHKPEEITTRLRQVDVLVSPGSGGADAVRSIAVTEVTYDRWWQEYGGLKSDQVERPKEFETENSRRRKAIADLTRDKPILQEASRGHFRAPRAVACVSITSVLFRTSPSGAPAGRSGSTGRRTGRCRGAEMTRKPSRPISSSWRASTVAAATARSRLCFAGPGGWSTTSASSGPGGKKG